MTKNKSTKKEWLIEHYKYQIDETKYLDDNMNKLLKNANEDELLPLFRQIALWKENRVVRIKDTKEVKKYLDIITRIKSREDVQKGNYDKEIKEVVNVLMQCEGVALPMASTILRFANPNIFPICDIRATRYIKDNDFKKHRYKRNNKKEDYSKCAEFYLEYIKKCYKEYEKINNKDGSLEFGDFDRFAYQKDKEKNNKKSINKNSIRKKRILENM